MCHSAHWIRLTDCACRLTFTCIQRVLDNSNTYTSITYRWIYKLCKRNLSKQNRSLKFAIVDIKIATIYQVLFSQQSSNLQNWFSGVTVWSSWLNDLRGGILGTGPSSLITVLPAKVLLHAGCYVLPIERLWGWTQQLPIHKETAPQGGSISQGHVAVHHSASKWPQHQHDAGL